MFRRDRAAFGELPTTGPFASIAAFAPDSRVVSPTASRDESRPARAREIALSEKRSTFTRSGTALGTVAVLA